MVETTQKTPQTLNQKVKEAGFSGVKELARLTSEEAQLIRRWHKEKPKRFKIFLAGARALLLPPEEAHVVIKYEDVKRTPLVGLFNCKW